MQGLTIDQQIARLRREFPDIQVNEIRHVFGAGEKADELNELLRSFESYSSEQRTPKARWMAACGAHPEWMRLGAAWYWIGKGKRPSEAEMVTWFEETYPQHQWIKRIEVRQNPK